MAPLIHLIAGSTGAGKTTYALGLADEIGGVRFSIDEWMQVLFWSDAPTPIDPVWAMARVERCYAQIWATAAQVAVRGVPCILDLGFTRADSRARFAELARDEGFEVKLHHLDVPADERWRRVQRRNAVQGETRQLAFDISPEMFAYVETLWDAPDDAELAAMNGVRV